MEGLFRRNFVTGYSSSSGANIETALPLSSRGPGSPALDTATEKYPRLSETRRPALQSSQRRRPIGHHRRKDSP
ncbi:unnamed protein product [Periconia digitata]|uniref:Uncharacterized protein n=1 Tax=Periconia digitata TaxID=1303443 RepID=A0A9W4XW86_9PLEO|nr:unnamed protein product [Periconia digitata]